MKKPVFEKIKPLFQKKGKASVHGSYSAGYTALFLAVLLMGNLIVSRLPSKYTKIDLSGSGLYSIGDQTKAVLDGLSEDVTLYLVCQEGNEDSTVTHLLEQYAENSDHVTLETKDPVKSPTFTQTYTTDQVADNSVIVVSGDRSKVISYADIYTGDYDYSTGGYSSSFDGEGQLTSAIAYVTTDDLPVLYVVTGHDEAEISSTVRSTIEKENIRLEDLNLMTDTDVPEDAAGLFLYAPIIILIVFSFNAGNSSSVWKGFSLKWYESLLSNRLIMNSVYTTLMVSLLSTIAAAIAGTFAAIGLYAMSRRRRTIVNSVNNIPMMNADIVTGVSLCLLFVVFFNGWGAFAGWVNSWQSAVVLPERLTMGFGTLLIAHICFNIPYVILSVGPKLRQMDRNLIDAAQDLGCTWMQAFWRVVIPEIKPGIVSGALTAFTMSVDDFIISYFTAGTSASTLAMTIYGMTKKRVSPEINAISTLLFVTVLVLLAIINLRDSHAARREHHAAATAASGAPMKHHRRPNKVLRRVAAGAMACALVAVLVVTGRSVQSERVVNVCSWGEYIDEELITQFEEETGIRVNYQTAESNEALYSLIKMGGADFDVIVPSDYMIARLIEEDMLAELDYSHIPNFDLIDDTYKNLSYDPENKYTVPYAWGTLGIIYNTTMVSGPITSWDAMFDPQYAGQVLMINNSRDALAAALLDLGYSINTTDESQLEEAFALLKNAKDSGVYQAFVMDEVFQKMEGGNAAIAMYYAGDYLTMLENNEDLAFVIPEEGSNWFVDAMCVLKDTQHMAEAEEWINFIASTSSNLANMDYIWYASPNREALEQYPAYYQEVNEEELDPEIFQIMAPPAETLDRCEIYENLPKETLKLYDRLWTRLGV